MHESIEIHAGSSVFFHAYLSRRIDNGDLQPILETSTNAQDKSQQEEIVAHFLAGNKNSKQSWFRYSDMPQLSYFTPRNSGGNTRALPASSKPQEPVQDCNRRPQPLKHRTARNLRRQSSYCLPEPCTDFSASVFRFSHFNLHYHRAATCGSVVQCAGIICTISIYLCFLLLLSHLLVIGDLAETK